MTTTFLRGQISDRATWREDVESLQEELAHTTAPNDLASICGRLGQLLSLDPTKRPRAIDLLRRAVELSRAHRPELLAPNLIRLATALQYAGDHGEAIPLFEDALKADDNYRHYAHQHYGKCLAEMGTLDEAQNHFQAALKLRKSLGDSKLLQSTRQAISELQQLNSQ